MDQQRFVALDVHKSYVMVGAVNSEQDIVLTPRRVALTSLETWCQKHLRLTDEVVLEATTNAWQIHDLLEPLVSRVIVAHPYHFKLIASSFVKTDKRIRWLWLACWQRTLCLRFGYPQFMSANYEVWLLTTID